MFQLARDFRQAGAGFRRDDLQFAVVDVPGILVEREEFSLGELMPADPTTSAWVPDGEVAVADDADLVELPGFLRCGGVGLQEICTQDILR